MQVTAFSTPAQPNWRWRISSYGGEVIEESRDAFETISVALAAGRTRLGQMDPAPETESRYGRPLPSFSRPASGR
jgi:hypothetical protein